MVLLSDQKIIVSAAPISGPEYKKTSEDEGNEAGKADREAKLFREDGSGKVVPLAGVHRVIDWYRSHLLVVGELVLRDREGPIAEAKSAHEQAAHELQEAEAKVSETGQAVWASVAERDATADQITKLVNPELVRHHHGNAPEDDPGVEDPPRAFRHILDRKLPKGWGYGVLLALAAAEGALNVQAFAATGDGALAADALAVLVGIGIVAMAHLIGGAAAELLENVPKARGRSPLRIAQVAVGVPALIIGILGTAAIRASYFAAQNKVNPQQQLHIPTPGLVALAFMLAGAAVIVSMAMHNPFADDLERQDEAIEDYRHYHEQARERLLAAQNVVSETGSKLWKLLSDLVNEYGINTGHVYQCATAYRNGYCRGAGICISAELPLIEPLDRVAQALAWLEANPYGTHAPPTLPYSAARKVDSSQPDMDEQKHEHARTAPSKEKVSPQENESGLVEALRTGTAHSNNSASPEKT